MKKSSKPISELVFIGKPNQKHVVRLRVSEDPMDREKGTIVGVVEKGYFTAKKTRLSPLVLKEVAEFALTFCPR